ncbi:hypothetical protein [Martelella soudanensis]|nr:MULTISPECIES: hypothetical protein [unclassified Martelella]
MSVYLSTLMKIEETTPQRWGIAMLPPPWVEGSIVATLNNAVPVPTL